MSKFVAALEPAIVARDTLWELIVLNITGNYTFPTDISKARPHRLYTADDVRRMYRLLGSMSAAAAAAQKNGCIPQHKWKGMDYVISEIAVHSIDRFSKPFSSFRPAQRLSVILGRDAVHLDVWAVELLAVAIGAGGVLWKQARRGAKVGPVQRERFYRARAAFRTHVYGKVQ